MSDGNQAAMNAPPRYYSPVETARRLGVTTKALRYYEQKGLVKPLRTANGWRTYGPVEMARLHQVFALKRLGLPLNRIAKLLAGQFSGLDGVLAVQEIALRRQLTDTEQALSLVVAARARLAAGDQLSSDDIVNLTRQTAMSNKVSESEADRIIQSVFDKHISSEEQDRMQANGYESTASSSAWDALHADAKALMAKGDTGSPEAMDLARRWMLEVNRATGGDRALNQKVKAVWQEALQSPTVQAQVPGVLEMFEFVREAYGKAIAAGVAT
jgi:DNA-binding transcriptional MerR regulator